MIYYSDERCALLQGDCLELMAKLPDQCAHAIIADPPYGTTACKWDSVIPFAPMWAQLKRLIKPRGATVLFGSQPFTSALIMSNLKMFKHQWIWNKKQSGSFANAKFAPLKIFEEINVFAHGKVTYFPQMKTGKPRKKGGAKKHCETMSKCFVGYPTFNDQYYPVAIIEFPNCSNKKENVHPTQKPVALLEYLIRTYTNEGETVLDFTMGSGTTGVACMKTGRKFISIERDEKYFQIAKERIINENNH